VRVLPKCLYSSAASAAKRDHHNPIHTPGGWLRAVRELPRESIRTRYIEFLFHI
jgi:hypothetical protein